MLQGSHYYFEGVKLAQGRDNVLLHLKENPDTAARVTTAVKNKMQEVGSRQPSTKAAKGSSSSSFDELDFEDELLNDEDLLKELEQNAGRLDGP